MRGLWVLCSVSFCPYIDHIGSSPVSQGLTLACVRAKNKNRSRPCAYPPLPLANLRPLPPHKLTHAPAQGSSTRPRGLQAPAQFNCSPPVSNPKSQTLTSPTAKGQSTAITQIEQRQIWHRARPGTAQKRIESSTLPVLFQTEIKRTQPRLVNPGATGGAGHKPGREGKQQPRLHCIGSG